MEAMVYSIIEANIVGEGKPYVASLPNVLSGPTRPSGAQWRLEGYQSAFTQFKANRAAPQRKS